MKEKYILLNGKKIPVSEEVYRAYKRPYWKEAKRIKRRSKNEILFNEDNYYIENINYISFEEQILDKLMIEKLHIAIKNLSFKEQQILNEIFFNNLSERQLSKKLGISNVSIHKIKKKILSKLNKILKK